VALTDVKMLRLPPAAVWVVQQEQRQCISKIPLFIELTEDEQYMLVAKLKPFSFPAGRYIMQEGEVGDMLFIMDRGVCDACKIIEGQEVVLAQLKRGDFFGELGVIFDMPRSASVRATTSVTTLSLSREDLAQAIGQDKMEKMKIIARAQVCGGIPLLSQLTPAAKNTIARRLQADTFKKNQTIVDKDDVSERIYMIEKGHVMITAGDDDKAQPLPVGMVFGMSRTLQGEAYDVKVVAGSDEVKTLSLSLKDVFASSGVGEQDALERQLKASLHRFLLKQVNDLSRKSDNFFTSALNHCEVLKVTESGTVFNTGDRVDSVYIVISGQFFMKDEDGETVMPDAGRIVISGSVAEPAAETFGEDFVDPEDPEPAKAPYTLQAAREGSLLRVPKSLLRQ